MPERALVDRLDDAIQASVGPFAGQKVRRELEADGEGMGLRRVLDTVVDRVEVSERGGSDWVRLTKRIIWPQNLSKRRALSAGAIESPDSAPLQTATSGLRNRVSICPQLA